MKDAQKNEAGYPINNADVRFVKGMELDALPAVGDRLTLTARPDHTFSATVVRVDWSDEKNMFTVACRYSERAIPREQYLALTSDTEWAMRSLL